MSKIYIVEVLLAGQWDENIWLDNQAVPHYREPGPAYAALMRIRQLIEERKSGWEDVRVREVTE